MIRSVVSHHNWLLTWLVSFGFKPVRLILGQGAAVFKRVFGSAFLHLHFKQIRRSSARYAAVCNVHFVEAVLFKNFPFDLQVEILRSAFRVKFEILLDR